MIQLPSCDQDSFICLPQLPEPTVVELVLDYCFAVSASLQLSAGAGHAKRLRQISGRCCCLLLHGLTSLGDASLTQTGSGTDTASLFVCCGSLINSLQSAVFKYNIPFQPRNANLRVIGCSTVFRQTSCKFVRVLSFLHFLFLSLLQRFYIFLTGIPVAVFLTYINVFIGECSVRAKQKSY